jgi:Na+/phosphate symporter
MKSVGDIILTKNALLTNHIVVEAEKLNKSANDSATLHEERLVLGICKPKSSSLFLDLLDSFKGILYHLKKIADASQSIHS